MTMLGTLKSQSMAAHDHCDETVQLAQTAIATVDEIITTFQAVGSEGKQERAAELKSLIEEAIEAVNGTAELFNEITNLAAELETL